MFTSHIRCEERLRGAVDLVAFGVVENGIITTTQYDASTIEQLETSNGANRKNV